MTKYYVKSTGDWSSTARCLMGDMSEGWAGKDLWVASEDAQIGWRWDGKAFIAPPPAPDPPTPSASDLDAMDTATLIATLSQPGTATRAVVKALLNQDNRLRVLEGKPSVSQTEFLTGLKALMRGA